MNILCLHNCKQIRGSESTTELIKGFEDEAKFEKAILARISAFNILLIESFCRKADDIAHAKAKIILAHQPNYQKR